MPKYNYLIILFAIIYTFACTTTKKQKGLEIFPDMAHTGDDSKHAVVFEAYDRNPIFADGKTSQEPPYGTIPRGYTLDFFPIRTGNDVTLKNTDGDKAGKELTNPVPHSKDAIARGERQFNIYCYPCHGNPKGKTSTLYDKGFKSAVEQGNKNMFIFPAGKIYYTITMGSAAAMPSYSNQISRLDRWKIVHYLMSLREGGGELPKEQKKDNKQADNKKEIKKLDKNPVGNQKMNR